MQVDLSSKAVICNFRRLPYWMESRIRYEAARSGQPVLREMYVQGRFFDAVGNESFADKTLYKFTERKVNHWIRMEYMIDDFYKAFSNYLDVRTVVKPSDFAEKLNVTEGDPHLDIWFTKSEIGQLYASNPGWAAVEKDLYGTLLSEVSLFV
jgi:hypothetical protein